MNIAVRYFTLSGNTKKLAESVAEAVSVEAKDVSTPLSQQTDILFLCCSYYAFDVDKAVKDFINQNHDKIGKVYCVGSSAMMKSMLKPVRKVADPFGIAVADEEFHCRGQFKMFHKGKPDANDLAAAAAFAKKVVEG